MLFKSTSFLKVFSTLTLYIVCTNLIAFAQPYHIPSDYNQDIAVLDFDRTSTEGDETSISEALYSARYICDITGYQYFTAGDLSEATQNARIILLATCLSSSSLSEQEFEVLIDWVKTGGILVTPAIVSATNVTRPYLAELFGIDPTNISHSSKARHIINWCTEDETMPELVYFDEPEEKATSIGRVSSYTFDLPETGGAEIMAFFDDGTPAVFRNSLGKGKVYMAGLTWRDVILRNQLNKDQSSSREYNNGFEPSADVWPLWVRAIAATASEVSVWKFTVPGGYTQLLIPTHDCDSQTAYDAMHYMADFESSIGCRGHYFLTTHYFRDRDYHDTSYLSAFYNANTIPKARALIEAGHTVGSHSVCHFPDFDKVRNMDEVTREEYAWRATCVDGTSTGASTWAEVVMSKQILEEDLANHVRSFRSGHLCNNPDMPEAMEIGGYEFASTYTGGDLLSEFPFFIHEQNNWSGRIMDILQIPLHISDVYNGDKPALNDDTWDSHPCVDQWESAMRRLRGNYASAVILIHPNREWKMTLQQRLTDRLDPEETGCYNFEDYGDFWRARLDAPCTLKYDSSKRNLRIITDPESVKANKMTFAVEAGEEPESVIVTDSEGGNALACSLRPIAPGRYLAVPEGCSGIGNSPLTEATEKPEQPLNFNGKKLTATTPGDLIVAGIDGSVVLRTRIQTSVPISLDTLSPGLYIARLGTNPGLKLLLR